jgi:DKNYY family
MAKAEPQWSVVVTSVVGSLLVFWWYLTDSASRSYRRSPLLNVAVVAVGFLAVPRWLIATALLVLPAVSYAMCGDGLFFYAKGDNGWYYHGSKIEGADPGSFRVLAGVGSDAFSNPCARDSGYAVDNAHVYRGAKTLPEADPATFVVLSGGYSRDATHVYFQDTVLRGADAKTFTGITAGYFKDAANVYLNGATVADADPGTFRSADNSAYPGTGLARDRAHVFFGASVVAEADPRDVKALGRQYWRSHERIFFADTLLANVEAATFRIAGADELAFSAQDRHHYFLGQHAVNKTDCHAEGEIVLACASNVLAGGHQYGSLDAASIHYLGRFQRRCDVIENSMIYQDDNGLYEVFGDGTIMKFLGVSANQRFEGLDKSLEDRLCDHPVTQSVRADQ